MSDRSWEAPLADLPPLPARAVSRDGCEFVPHADIWPLSALTQHSTSFNFAQFSFIGKRMKHKLKLALVWYLEHCSFSHAKNLYNRFVAFYFKVFSLRNDICDTVEISDILNYRATLNHKTEWKLGTLRILLEGAGSLGCSFCSQAVQDYLREATIRGNIKGTSIRTRDPKGGAFSNAELMSIQAAMNDAYAEGRIKLYPYAAVWLFLAYGPRPIQIAALKESDLVVAENNDGRAYALRMPRAKQHGQGLRTAFKTRYCSKQIGILLEEVILANRKMRKQVGLVGDDWPMFMARQDGELPGLRFHMSSQQIGYLLNEAAARVIGLKTNAKRFRITLAQRAVDDGKDKHTVAELLDHSDTQNVGVYYEASPAMVPRLDRHLAMELAPIAQAFAGVVVAFDEKHGREINPSSRIFDRSLNNAADEALGLCGQMSFCGLAIPYACYTCRHFKPWLDGPHEEFMAALIDDRERMIAEDISPKLYTIRDRTILAVAEVIQLCAAQLDEEEVAA
ncbi:site-specific integrase [Rhizobium leguminosarum]|uniref:site-specific integrase n=1 Tax=Rhizobium leguminosarum TaxID=384 RepID=UPI00103CE926|nr:site-specific integrase [Rhizobium leguminosarum]TCA66468.1 site-specific integrase [Rhizobium leguminosarum bv. viciae]TCB30392.1 site-specific integrase [Rhizobium leguminosarum bv. viciae]